MKPVYIYALLDPEARLVRYVGKSTQPHKRLRQHILSARRGGDRRICRWIRSLLERGLLPQMLILERAMQDSWESAEQYWITAFREDGADLTNHTDGGDGAHNPDDESRAKLSETRKQLWRTDTKFRERMLEVFRSPERCQHISEALTGKPHSADHVVKLPQNRKGWHQSEEAKAKISESLRGNQYARGMHHTDATKELLRQRSLGNQYGKGYVQTDEDKLARSIALQNRPKTDQHKRKISEGAKARWAKEGARQRNPASTIEWPTTEWMERQLEHMPIKSLAAQIGVKPGTLSAKLFRERRKTAKGADNELRWDV